MRRQLVPAIISMVIFTVLLGIAYPLVVTGVGQVAFKDKANGSLVSVNGKQVGSSLLAQAFTNAKGNPIKKYFQERPSAANYDPTYSTGSNYGPLNPKLIGNDPGVNIDTKTNPYRSPDDPTCVPVQSTDKAGNPKVDAKGNPIYDKNNDGTYVCDPNTAPQRAIAYRKLNGLSDNVKIPVDAVTASAPASTPTSRSPTPASKPHASRHARGLPRAQVLNLIDAHTDGRPLGFIGEKTVNVLDLNLALDALNRETRLAPPGSLIGMARGKLRIYLGAAPGVGKTYAMLNEGWRRHERGTDVVVGLFETHGRPSTAAQLRDLEVVPAQARSSTAAARSRRWTSTRSWPASPTSSLVDELAHTNLPGSRNEKRWQDVEELLDAGIDVISTLNIQHLESVNDVVERITGVKQQETIPDAIVRQAEQVELVDMTPEAIRRRMAHGNIYPAERVDASLANYFRPGNLAALREIALLWVADRVEENLQQYLEDHGIEGSVGDPRARAGRAHRRAGRRRADPPRRAHGPPRQGRPRSACTSARPTDSRNGRPSCSSSTASCSPTSTAPTRRSPANDVGEALASFAKAERATQIVLGASRRSRWTDVTRGSIITRVLRAADEIDVHVISTKETEEPAGGPAVVRRRRTPAISRRRQGTALLLAARRCSRSLTLIMDALRSQLSLPSELLIYLLACHRRSPRSAGSYPRCSPRSRRSCAPTGSSRRRSTPSRSPRTTTSSRWSCSSSSPPSSASSSARPRAGAPRARRCRPTPRRSRT